MKKFLLWSVVLCAVAGMVAGNGLAAEKVYKIGIAQFVTVPPLDQARKGFIDQMAAEGFIEGKNVEYDVDNAETDMSVAASIAKKFVSRNVDLILAIATPMSQACVAAAENTDIPIIFNSVTDPVAAGLVESWEKPGGKVTGAADWADVSKQVALMLEISPSIKKVGTLYNAGETNSIVQAEELKKAAAGLGIEKVIEANVASTADVMAGAKSLVGRVDAIWIPTDNVIMSAVEAVVKVCEDNKIPFFGSDVNQVQRGVIASAGVDFYEIGKTSGAMGARVLKGEKPADIPVTKGIMKELHINLPAAERMGVTIPQAVLDRATQIYKE